MTLKIGHIKYANCTPIFTALCAAFDCSRYTFVEGVPSALNAQLRAGGIDVSPSSSIEYAMASERYCLLPDLSISSVGQVKSVLLFSRVPVEELDGAAIGLTMQSDTSVNLLKVLLAKQFNFANTFERTAAPLAEALESYPALLLIGDAALQAAALDHGVNVYDLGDLWYRFTGLPFVFALWIVRREAALAQRAALTMLSADLVAAKEQAYRSYDRIAAECVERQWMDAAQLEDYWRTISYDLTPRHLEGVSLFFRYAFELGLIPAQPQLTFFCPGGELKEYCATG